MQAEFEPGSRNRVLRNLLGIVRVRDMEDARIGCARDRAGGCTGTVSDRRIDSARATFGSCIELWLGRIYAWAGEYRNSRHRQGRISVRPCGPHPASHGGIRERSASTAHTVRWQRSRPSWREALAEVHAELILIHPFRDGNGRLARLAGSADGTSGRSAGSSISGHSIGRASVPTWRRFTRPWVATMLPLADLFRRVIDETVASSTR